MSEADSKIIDEIHAIREKIHEETKNMTVEEKVEYINTEARKFFEEQNMKIIPEKNINGFKVVRNS